MLEIEVVYALPDRQVRYRLKLGEGCTVADAIRSSGVLNDFPDIDLERTRVGIFGGLAELERSLRDGDRVEIYRLLRADPKDVRRKRAVRR